MPPVWIAEPFSGGQVTSRDRMDLRGGELQQTVGCWYRPGDQQRIHKQRGRTVFADTGSAAKIAGLHLCQFDNGADQLVALSGTILYGSTPGLTGTFSSLKTGLTTGAASLSATHYNDRWYMANGLDVPFVLEDDGSVRDVGMVKPDVPTTLTSAASGGSTELDPAAPASATSKAYMANTVGYDGPFYGYFDLRGVSGPISDVWSGDEWTGAGSAAQLQIDWGNAWSGPEVTILFEVDTGAGYSTVMSLTTTSAVPRQMLQIPISPADYGSVLVRITLSGSEASGQLNIYNVGIKIGSSAANFSGDVMYAVSEYDATRGQESLLSDTVTETFATHNQVSMNLPTAKNSRATHINIYRAPTDVTSTGQLGMIASVPVADSTYLDMFEVVGEAEQATPVFNWIEQFADTGVIRYPRDTPPLTMDRIISFKGQLVGLKGRGIYYTPPGFPESWPTLYIVAGVPLPEHDKFKDGVDLGRVLILGAAGAMLRIEDLPLVLNGQFVPGQAEQIKGAPGVVGPKALTAFSVSGESRAAWVSPYGVYVSDGYNIERISDMIDWSVFDGVDQSDWTLHWDPDRFVLVMAYSTGSSLNRFALFHMHPDHKGKITWGHYGKIADLASGQVSNQRRLYSGHATDGKVYTEDQGGTDASNSYNASGVWPMVVQTRRMVGEGQEWSTLAGRIGHTDFGTGQEATVAWKVGRDISTYEETITKTVSLEGHRRERFDVARGGEWHEVTITHTGSGTGALLDLQMQARSLGRVGKVSVT